MISPADLERRAVELYTCPCGAALDYPGAWCPACDEEGFDPTPAEDCPDAADLYDARRPASGFGLGDLAAGLVLAPMFAVALGGVLLDVHQVDAAIIAAKATAWAWLLGVL